MIEEIIPQSLSSFQGTLLCGLMVLAHLAIALELPVLKHLLTLVTIVTSGHLISGRELGVESKILCGAENHHIPNGCSADILVARVVHIRCHWPEARTVQICLVLIHYVVPPINLIAQVCFLVRESTTETVEVYDVLDKKPVMVGQFLHMGKRSTGYLRIHNWYAIDIRNINRLVRPMIEISDDRNQRRVSAKFLNNCCGESPPLLHLHPKVRLELRQSCARVFLLLRNVRKGFLT